MHLQKPNFAGRSQQHERVLSHSPHLRVLEQVLARAQRRHWHRPVNGHCSGAVRTPRHPSSSLAQGDEEQDCSAPNAGHCCRRSGRLGQPPKGRLRRPRRAPHSGRHSGNGEHPVAGCECAGPDSSGNELTLACKRQRLSGAVSGPFASWLLWQRAPCRTKGRRSRARPCTCAAPVVRGRVWLDVCQQVGASLVKNHVPAKQTHASTSYSSTSLLSSSPTARELTPAAS